MYIMEIVVKLLKSGGGGLVTNLCPTLGIPWTVACQTPLSMGFFRQEYWSGLTLPPPGDLPNPSIKPGSPASPSCIGTAPTLNSDHKSEALSQPSLWSCVRKEGTCLLPTHHS